MPARPCICIKGGNLMHGGAACRPRKELTLLLLHDGGIAHVVRASAGAQAMDGPANRQSPCLIARRGLADASGCGSKKRGPARSRPKLCRNRVAANTPERDARLRGRERVLTTRQHLPCRMVNQAATFPARATRECRKIEIVGWEVVRVHPAGRSRLFRLPPAGRDRFVILWPPRCLLRWVPLQGEY
jgi:hypothetical protein